MKITKWNGRVISKPGIYSGVPLELYHSAKILNGPAVSSSHLRRLSARSPAHFFDAWPGNPDFTPAPDAPHLVLGRASHHLFLGEMQFQKSYVPEPLEYPDAKTGEMKPWTYAANYCKQWREVQRQAALSILKPEDFNSIRGMAKSLSANPLVKDGVLNGLIEHSVFWLDEPTGLWLKIRPDAIPTSSVDFVDLKTTRSVLKPDLKRSIAQFGYHQQGALICRGAREVLGIKSPSFTLVFAEHKQPYCVRVVSLKDEDLARGEAQNRRALDTIARCIRSGVWPGPGGEARDAEYIDLPDWYRKSVDDREEHGASDDD